MCPLVYIKRFALNLDSAFLNRTLRLGLLAVIKPASLVSPTPRPECGAGASLVGLGEGAKGDVPFSSAMLELDDSDFTPDHREYLQEWANNLGVPLEVLLGRIVIATCEGDLYIENAPRGSPLSINLHRSDKPCLPNSATLVSLYAN